MARKEILKTYHGIPKALTDKDTILYVSLNGSTVPEIGNITFNQQLYSDTAFTPHIVGLGLDTGSCYCLSYDKFKPKSPITVDMWYTPRPSGDASYLFRLKKPGEVTFRALRLNRDGMLYVNEFNNNANASNKMNTVLKHDIPHHIRFVMDDTNNTLYVNGKLIGKAPSSVPLDTLTELHLGTYDLNWCARGIISDIHISNVDRGDVFPNLPQDFIDGKAVVQPLIGQRRIWSDTNTLNKMDIVVPHKDASTQFMYRGDQLFNLPEITVEKAETWESGSKIKIKGYDGDLITASAPGNLPEVTTTEGTNVVGSWTGLSTSEATFTLGANSNIQGKDLRVVYYNYSTPKYKSQFGDKVPTKLVKAYEFDGTPIPVSSLHFVPNNRSIGRLGNNIRKPFVSEVEVIVNPTQVSSRKTVRVIKEVKDYFVTDVGNILDIPNSPFNHVLQRLQSNDNSLVAQVGYVNLPVDILGINANLGRDITISDVKIEVGNLQESIPTDIIGKTSGILRYLVEDQGELKLLLHVTPPTNGIRSNKTVGKVFLIPIEGRPLIKGGI